LKEQELFNKPNGRGLCQVCKREPLIGNQRQRCQSCQNKDNAKSERCDGDYLFEGRARHKSAMNGERD
jgi:hypothetical protein